MQPFLTSLALYLAHQAALAVSVPIVRLRCLPGFRTLAQFAEFLLNWQTQAPAASSRYFVHGFPIASFAIGFYDLCDCGSSSPSWTALVLAICRPFPYPVVRRVLEDSIYKYSTGGLALILLWIDAGDDRPCAA